MPAKSLVEKLSHYTLDFVIDEKSDSYKKSSGIKSIDLFDEEYCLVYSKDKFKISSLQDLNDLPFILPVSTKQERKLFEEYLSDNQISRKLSVETSNYYSSIEYAKKGLGIALVPKSMVNDELGTFNIDLKKAVTLSYVENNLSPSSKEFLKEFLQK